MTRLTFIGIALACCALSALAGRQYPDDQVAAVIKAEGFSAGRQDVIDNMPKPAAPVVLKPTAEQCIAWWANTNIKEAKHRLCGK